MKKVGTYIAVFIASLLGVLAAFQLDRFRDRDPLSFLKDRNLPSATPVSLENIPPGPPDFRIAAKKVMPSVVSVDQRVATRDFFSDRIQIETAGSGSGVIVSADGLILTNNHVIANADFVTVRTQEDKTYAATVVGRDPRSDLAVLKIKANGLTPAQLGDSDKAEVGQWVLAVGNPLGYADTVSAGVVSSLKRTLPAGDTGTLLVDAIQTDAAINPGNSGGALANDRGEIIGINSAIASNTGTSIGVGFAIPINHAKKVFQDIVKYGKVSYGDPGFSVYQRLIQDGDVQDTLRRIADADPPKTGLVVHRVYPEGAAERAGIKELDVVVSVDGVPMTNPVQFFKVFNDKRPGQKISMTVWQAGKIRNLEYALDEEAS